MEVVQAQMSQEDLHFQKPEEQLVLQTILASILGVLESMSAGISLRSRAGSSIGLCCPKPAAGPSCHLLGLVPGSRLWAGLYGCLAKEGFSKGHNQHAQSVLSSGLAPVTCAGHLLMKFASAAIW